MMTPLVVNPQSGGGGGSPPNLATVLTAGNLMGGTPIQASSNGATILNDASGNPLMQLDSGGNVLFQLLDATHKVKFYCTGGSSQIAIGYSDSYFWNFGLNSANQDLVIVEANGQTLSLTNSGLFSIYNSSTAQELRIYNTTDGSGNAEWGGTSWQTSSNTLQFGTWASGTGNLRTLQLVVGGTPMASFDALGLSFFGVVTASQQTGGAATAGSVYTSTEQTMLQTAYNCLRTFGFLT